MIITLVHEMLQGFTGSMLAWVVGLIGSIMLWWWTARLMVRGEVRWRALLPTAVAMGVGTAAYTLAASVWMPALVASHFAQFGAFGITQSLVAWFTGLALLAVTSAALGPAIAEGDGGLARWMHAGHPTVVQDGAPPALPGPTRPMGSPDAFADGSERQAPSTSSPPPRTPPELMLF